MCIRDSFIGAHQPVGTSGVRFAFFRNGSVHGLSTITSGRPPGYRPRAAAALAPRAELPVERAEADSEQGRRLRLVAPGMPERGGDQCALRLLLSLIHISEPTRLLS